MTSLPPNADELVSAYLDGEAAPDEIVIVESNEELLARVEALRGVTNQLGAPVTPPPPELRELHLSAALGAFDEMMMATEAEPAVAATAPAPPLQAVPPLPETEMASQSVAQSSPPASENVRSLADQREKRNWFSSRIVAVAAALLFVVVGASIYLGGNRANDSLEVANAPSIAADTQSESSAAASDDGDFGGLSDAAPPAAAAQDSAEANAFDDDAMEDEDDEVAMEEEAMADDEAMEDEAMDDEEAMEDGEAMADESAGTTDDRVTPNFDLEQFGEFAESSELDDRLDLWRTSRLESGTAFLVSPEGLFLRCQDQIPELAEVEGTTLVGEATVTGEPVEIHLLPSDTEAPSLYVVRPNTCDIVTIIGP